MAAECCVAKHRVFLAAPPGLARDRFRRRILNEMAPAMLAAAPDLIAASACLVDATPATPPWQRPGEPTAPADPPFDAVLDLWGPGTALGSALACLGGAPAGRPARRTGRRQG
jgi:hypothetical protein